MKAIVRQAYGGPEQLYLREVPDPSVGPGEVLIRVKAFGINRAEQYFRLGHWGEVAAISGIECVGEVVHDTTGILQPDQCVLALMGGMGRTRSGSYAEFVAVPSANVVPVRTTLEWADLAALPESYATAWSCLHDNLAICRGQTVLVRGATSALGLAALNLAKQAGVRVVATLRHAERERLARDNGADEVLIEGGAMEEALRHIAPTGLDAVLDLIGNSTLLQSLQMVRRGGRVCLAGFLGGHAPIEQFDPLAHMSSGRHLSFFGSAFVYGTPEYPLTDIPFQDMVEWAETGAIKLKPARVFKFDEMQDVHRLLDAGTAGGKMVVVCHS